MTDSQKVTKVKKLKYGIQYFLLQSFCLAVK